VAALPGLALAQAVDRVPFDAIFYRARPAFNYCYAFEGTVGYSLRPLGDQFHISHVSPPTACPRFGATSPQGRATGDCRFGPCQADCTSLVRKAWNSTERLANGRAETSASLLTRDTPDACRVGQGRSSFARIVDMGASDEDIRAQLRAVRPGDGCENTHHTILMVARRRDGKWSTWEAQGSVEGIGPLTRELRHDFLTQTSGDVCSTGFAGNGCWRPNAERTFKPELFAPQNGSELTEDEVDDLVFKFERPANFHALADYLLWLRWDDNEAEGGEPKIEHRLIRIPAFSERFAAPDVRLADFPNVGVEDACGGGRPAEERCPRDVTNLDRIEVPFSRLRQWVAPDRFKPEGEGSIVATWSEPLVPCVPTLANTAIPSPRPAERDCGFLDVPPTLELKKGTTYFWRIRIDRYGEKVSSSFRRRQVIGRCDLDPTTGFERDERCKDPRWSAEASFRVKEDEESPLSGPPVIADAVFLNAAQQELFVAGAYFAWTPIPGVFDWCVTVDSGGRFTCDDAFGPRITSPIGNAGFALPPSEFEQHNARSIHPQLEDHFPAEQNVLQLAQEVGRNLASTCLSCEDEGCRCIPPTNQTCGQRCCGLAAVRSGFEAGYAGWIITVRPRPPEGCNP
jgi:hypothetical protein